MKIFIFGASGQGKVVLDILRENKNFEICGFVDNNKQLKGKVIDGIKVLGDSSTLDDLKQQGIQGCIVAMGDTRDRYKVANELKQKGFYLINAIHARASIATNVLIGNNVTISIGAVICAHSVIEDNVIINSGAIVEHDNIIRNGAHVGPGARLAGKVEVGEKTFVGIGATVIQNIKIGKNSIIGAGAVVLGDIPDNVVAVGVPAKVIRSIIQDDLFG